MRYILTTLILSTLLLCTGCGEPYVLLDYLDGQSIDISPANATVTTQAATQFAASGGTSPYTYDVVSGPGVIDSSSGVYTSAVGGSAVVRAEDPRGGRVETTVQVLPTSATGVWVSPTLVTLNVGQTVYFSAGGGDGVYTFTVDYGDGAIDSGTGVYMASLLPLGVSMAIIQVEDGSAATAQATVKIVDPSSPYTVTPSAAALYLGDSVDFTAVGATPDVWWGTVNISSSTPLSPGDSVTYTPTATGAGAVFTTDDSGAGIQFLCPVVVLSP